MRAREQVRRRRDNQFTAKASDVLHAALIGGSQYAADGGDIGEHVEAQYALDERVVFVITDVAQSSIPCQHMDDEQ